MRALYLAVTLLAAVGLAAQTARNDDSCDISTLPAATLLLPYFEVDIASPPEKARTTLFTVVNTTQLPQIAHVTIWSDWGYPVVDFNIFLTGYDVQAINLYDVIAAGVLAPPDGTSNASTPGRRSLSSINGNPHFLPSAAAACSRTAQPDRIPATILPDVHSGLTNGVYSSCGIVRVGSTHGNAIGYVTIDLVATCTTASATEGAYYASELLFDNVLTGDYQIVDPATGTAQAATMVHIRAVPEGGPAGLAVATNLTHTFYDRYTPPGARKVDRRQPLPGVYAARYIQGGPGGYRTDFTIWREGVTASSADCRSYIENGRQTIAELVRFDERENPTLNPPVITGPGPVVPSFTMPAAGRISTTSSGFPPLTSGDLAGWMYLNLANDAPLGVVNPYSTVRVSQAWVLASMSAGGRYLADFEATGMGNGCSAPAPVPTNASTTPIAPRP